MAGLMPIDKENQPPIISAYDNEGFTIAGEFIKGSVIITGAEGTGFEISNWPGKKAEAISPKKLELIYKSKNTPDLIILGVGQVMDHPFQALRADLSKHAIATEIQITPAACRTWNLLLSEGRKVAFAAIAH